MSKESSPYLEPKPNMYIYSHGEYLQSTYPRRRDYYIMLKYEYFTSSITPSNNDLENIIHTNNELIVKWSSKLPTHEEIIYHNNNELKEYYLLVYTHRPWWIEYNQCKMCRRKFEHEQEMWINQMSLFRPFEDIETMCMRHYLIKFLLDISYVVRNSPIELQISPNKFYLIIRTGDDTYKIDGTREKAILHAKYRNKEYTFTYRNHANAYPYASSYDMILFMIFSMIRQYILIVSDVINNKARPYNVIASINNKIYRTYAVENEEET